MKSTGKGDAHTKISDNPSEVFLKYLRVDIKKINAYYTPKEARVIKKDLIQELLNDL